MPPELALITLLVFAFAITGVSLVVRKQERIARMRQELYLKMLETGKVSKEEMEEMLRGMGGRRSRAVTAGEHAPRAGGFLRFLAGVGWLGLMVAAGLFVARMSVDSSDQEEFGIAAAIVGGVSLGLVGLPFALQEFAGRAPEKRAQ